MLQEKGNAMRDKWIVTIYNQLSPCSFYAYGDTRAQAFQRASEAAGDDWFKAGNRDIRETMRDLFAHLMKSYRKLSPSGARIYVESPKGCGVEISRHN